RLDGLGERLVTGGAAHGVAHELRVPAELRRLLAELAADHVAPKAEQSPAEAGHRVLERRHVTVPAATAVELELIPVVAAAVRVIVGEEDHPGHGNSPREVCRGTVATSTGRGQQKRTTSGYNVGLRSVLLNCRAARRRGVAAPARRPGRQPRAARATAGPSSPPGPPGASSGRRRRRPAARTPRCSAAR